MELGGCERLHSTLTILLRCCIGSLTQMSIGDIVTPFRRCVRRAQTHKHILQQYDTYYYAFEWDSIRIKLEWVNKAKPREMTAHKTQISIIRKWSNQVDCSRCNNPDPRALCFDEFFAAAGFSGIPWNINAELFNICLMAAVPVPIIPSFQRLRRALLIFDNVCVYLLFVTHFCCCGVVDLRSNPVDTVQDIAPPEYQSSGASINTRTHTHTHA